MKTFLGVIALAAACVVPAHAQDFPSPNEGSQPAAVTAQNAAQQLHKHSRKRRLRMKYLFAWILGIPGGLIVIWFLFNHLH